MTNMGQVIRRIKLLISGWAQWSGEDGITWEKMSWKTRWELAGIHSYNWKWVRRHGKRPCGCTINPVTRRRVLTDIHCPQHGWTHYL